MFTGIVEEVGTIRQIKHGRHSAVLTIQAKTVLEGTGIGDSIAVNGICLTVTQLFPDGFSADVMHETLNRSSLARLTAGSRVNLERAMAANGRFGGHIVAGHVDGVGRIANIRRDDTAVWYTVHAGPEILRYVVEKGSITIDGISLTVAYVDDACFRVSIKMCIRDRISSNLYYMEREFETLQEMLEDVRQPRPVQLRRFFEDILEQK